MRVLCAIPCLDEEVAIGSVVLSARRHAAEVLVVDDGSTDRTSEVAALAGAKLLRHPKNLGKGAAYRTLWDHARGGGFDALVALDGDGQHDPAEIPLLVACLEAGDDVVVGSRWGARTEMPLWRRVGKRVLDYGTALAASDRGGGGPALTDSQSGFRAYSRRALEAIRPSSDGFAVESQLLIDAHRAGLRIGETPIHCRYDVDSSTLGPVRHAGGVLNDLIFQIGIRHPLLLLGLPGILLLALGLTAAFYGMWTYQEGGAEPLFWMLAGGIAVPMGLVGMFAGLLFNVLPRIVRAAPRERA